MEKLYLILIEFCFFLTLGLAYYTIQKRRILRRDLFENLDKLRNILNNYDADHDHLENLMNQHKISELLDALAKISFKGGDKDSIERIKTNLRFHL